MTEIKIVKTAPAGFQSFTRSVFHSEASAMRAARKRAKSAGRPVYVLHQPESSITFECWLVGHVA